MARGSLPKILMLGLRCFPVDPAPFCFHSALVILKFMDPVNPSLGQWEVSPDPGIWGILCQTGSFRRLEQLLFNSHPQLFVMRLSKG